MKVQFILLLIISCMFANTKQHERKLTTVAEAVSCVGGGVCGLALATACAAVAIIPGLGEACVIEALAVSSAACGSLLGACIATAGKRRTGVVSGGLCAAKCYQSGGSKIDGAACLAHCAMGRRLETSIRKTDLLSGGVCAAQCAAKGMSIDGAACLAHCAMGRRMNLKRVERRNGVVSGGMCAAQCAAKGMSIDGAACLAHCAMGRRMTKVIRRDNMLSNGICAAQCAQKGMSIDGAACLAHCAMGRRF